MHRIICLHSLGFVLITSCAPLQSPKQESDNNVATPTKMIDGAEITLTSAIRRQDTGKHQFNLAGDFTVSTSAGQPLPASLEISQFTLRASKPGFFVHPFSRRQNGKWNYGGRTTLPYYEPKITVTTQRNTSSIVIQFNWKEVGGGWTDKPSNYDRVDVSVRFADPAGNQHVLSNLAVPAAH